jgi:hypothetical protein
MGTLPVEFLEIGTQYIEALPARIANCGAPTLDQGLLHLLDNDKKLVSIYPALRSSRLLRRSADQGELAFDIYRRR